MAVTWSPDDRRLISSGADHSVRIWDVGTRNLLKVLNGHEDVVYYAEELLEWANFIIIYGYNNQTVAN